MWLTNSPDFHHIDLNTTSIHIEKKQDWWSSFDSAIKKVNSKLALENLKMELPKTIEQKINQAKENLYKNKDFKWALENEFQKWIKINYITDNLFSVYSNETNDISFFINEKWETLIFVSYREDTLVDENNKFLDTSIETFKETWYFMDAENQTRDIYKIIWEDENGKLILSEKPLNKNSVDYFNALKKIINYSDTLDILFALKHNWNIGNGHIDDYINSWALNLKFLQLMRNKKLFERPDVFEYALKKMKVTVEDIVKAKENWDITEEQWRKIYKVLQKLK